VLTKYHVLQILYCVIGDVMVSVLASSTVDGVFKPRSGQFKDSNIGMCCFFGTDAALKRKNNKWLARIRILCPSVISTHGLLFQWVSTVNIQVSMMA